MTCPRCLGEGRLEFDSSLQLRVRCFTCNGSGRIPTPAEEAKRR